LQQKLEIAFDSDDDLKKFFEGAPIANGATVSAGGTAFTLVDHEDNKGFGLDTVASIATDIAAGVAAHFITDWLVAKLSRSAKFVRYRGQVYQITKEDMARLVKVLESE
jgi:hypothetical protein